MKQIPVQYVNGVSAVEAQMQRKSVVDLSQWGLASRNDGQNFRTNMVTLAQYNDASAAGSGSAGCTRRWCSSPGRCRAS